MSSAAHGNEDNPSWLAPGRDRGKDSITGLAIPLTGSCLRASVAAQVGLVHAARRADRRRISENPAQPRSHFRLHDLSTILSLAIISNDHARIHTPATGTR